MQGYRDSKQRRREPIYGENTKREKKKDKTYRKTKKTE